MGEQSDDFSEFTAMLGRARDDSGRSLFDRSDPVAIAARRRRRVRRAVTAGIVLLVVLGSVGAYVPWALLAPTANAAGSVTTPVVAAGRAAAFVLPPEGESAISATAPVGFEGTPGFEGAPAIGQGVAGILASGGGADAVPIASISKLITALVVLDAKPLAVDQDGPSITFSKADHDLYDKYYVMNATVARMPTGSVISERKALELMLVASACNYADAVSTWAFGSPTRYLGALKTWLSAHGLAGTRMVEPTGIDAHNVSTPADLVAIGKLAMANPAVAAIVQSANLTVPNVGQFANTNDMLGIDGINGIKTGTLDQFGSNLLYSAVVGVGASAPITVVGVSLGGSSRESVDASVRLLLASIAAGFHRVPVITKGQLLGTYTTPWGDGAQIVAAEDASVFTWSDTPISAVVTLRAVKTGRSGATVGSVKFVAGKDTVSVPLELKGTIAGPDDWWRLTHPPGSQK